eukprot:gene6313-7477_t
MNGTSMFRYCKQPVRVVQTSQGNGDRWAVKSNLTWGTPAQSGDNMFYINTSVKYQTMEGFGGAFTDASAHNFFLLNSTNQQQFLHDYFDSEHGLGYKMARLPIGSCDFSFSTYNYDNYTNDTTLEHFSISHDLDQIIPLIRAAHKVSKEQIKIVASPWSPPGWMKENGWQVCGIATCLFCRLRKEYSDTWALYFSKFVDAYKKEGIPIWAVTVQNEPGACPVTYEGMHWDPATERDFIKQSLGPILKGQHPDVKIFIYDHNKKDVMQWVNTILGDPDTAKYSTCSSYLFKFKSLTFAAKKGFDDKFCVVTVEGTAVHWYDGDHFDQLAAAHQAQPTKALLASEATVARNLHPSKPIWKDGEHYAHDIIGDLNNFVIGWIDWNLLLDKLGGPDKAGPEDCEGIIKCGSSGMMMADMQQQVIYKQTFYWYMGHFSRHIKPGSIRVGLTSITSSLEATSWQTPANETVLVLLNREDTAAEFQVVVGDLAVRNSIPPHAMQTLTCALGNDRQQQIEIFDMGQSQAKQNRLDEPLFQALQAKDCVLVQELLLNGGADVNMTDKKGHTPLFRACRLKSTELVKILANAGGTILPYERYKTLELVIKSNAVEILQTLLATGVDVSPEELSFLKWTERFFGYKKGNDRLLQLALKQGNIEILKLLVEHGACIHFIDYSFVIPLDPESNPEIAAYLRTAQTSCDHSHGIISMLLVIAFTISIFRGIFSI